MFDPQSFELTTEQAFEMQVFRNSVGAIPREVLEGEFLKALELNMRQRNIMNDLAKQVATGERHAVR